MGTPVIITINNITTVSNSVLYIRYLEATNDETIPIQQRQLETATTIATVSSPVLRRFYNEMARRLIEAGKMPDRFKNRVAPVTVKELYRDYVFNQSRDGNDYVYRVLPVQWDDDTPFAYYMSLPVLSNDPYDIVNALANANEVVRIANKSINVTFTSTSTTTAAGLTNPPLNADTSLRRRYRGPNSTSDNRLTAHTDNASSRIPIQGEFTVLFPHILAPYNIVSFITPPRGMTVAQLYYNVIQHYGQCSMNNLLTADISADLMDSIDFDYNGLFTVSIVEQDDDDHEDDMMATD